MGFLAGGCEQLGVRHGERDGDADDGQLFHGSHVGVSYGELDAKAFCLRVGKGLGGARFSDDRPEGQVAGGLCTADYDGTDREGSCNFPC